MKKKIEKLDISNRTDVSRMDVTIAEKLNEVIDVVNEETPEALGATGGKKKWAGKTEKERKAIMAKVRGAKLDKDK